MPGSAILSCLERSRNTLSQLLYELLGKPLDVLAQINAPLFEDAEEDALCLPVVCPPYLCRMDLDAFLLELACLPGTWDRDNLFAAAAVVRGAALSR